RGSVGVPVLAEPVEVRVATAGEGAEGAGVEVRGAREDGELVAPAGPGHGANVGAILALRHVAAYLAPPTWHSSSRRFPGCSWSWGSRCCCGSGRASRRT